MGMNRDFIYSFQRPEFRQRTRTWLRLSNTLNRWLWGALCCGVPGIPCYFCTCCEKIDDVSRDVEEPQIHQESAAAIERLARPHRPNAPRARGQKSTPETLSAVIGALSQLQGDSIAPVPPFPDVETGPERKIEPG